MIEPSKENLGEFISLGDALKSAIKQGLIPIPRLVQDNQRNTQKEGQQDGAN
jgi:hypothetical protein